MFYLVIDIREGEDIACLLILRDPVVEREHLGKHEVGLGVISEHCFYSSKACLWNIIMFMWYRNVWLYIVMYLLIISWILSFLLKVQVFIGVKISVCVKKGKGWHISIGKRQQTFLTWYWSRQRGLSFFEYFRSFFSISFIDCILMFLLCFCISEKR